ncbi:JHE-like toxin PirA [Alcaligenes ammonioxydans]|uniref:JHE-like toxin PirA n=1 Tax=Alcaligenes ammonioxydans TaxID=2582914 RepID=UPI003D240E66
MKDQFSNNEIEKLSRGVGLETSPADESVQLLSGGTFTVPKHGSVQAAKYSTPVIPEIHKSYWIFNAGKANKIKAVFYWSHSFTSSWFEYSSVEVGIGEEKKLQAPSNSLYYSKVVLFNGTYQNATVSVTVAK